MCGGGDDGPKQTPEERELGRIAIERWNDYQTRFRPVENEYIEAVQMNDTDFDQVRASTASSVQQGFNPAEIDLTNNLFAKGMNMESSQFGGALDDFAIDRAVSLGTGLNEAELAVDTAHLKGLQNVVAMGQGQAMESINGLGHMAGDATRDAIDRSVRSYQDKQAGLQLVGQVAGAGMSYGMNQMPSVNTQGQSQPLYNNPAYVKNF